MMSENTSKVYHEIHATIFNEHFWLDPVTQPIWKIFIPDNVLEVSELRRFASAFEKESDAFFAGFPPRIFSFMTNCLHGLTYYRTGRTLNGEGVVQVTGEPINLDDSIPHAFMLTDQHVVSLGMAARQFKKLGRRYRLPPQIFSQCVRANIFKDTGR